MQKSYLIIGASAAGVSAAAKLRQLDATSEIVVLTEETDAPYNKCFLADYLSGLKDLNGLLIKKETFFEDQNITLKLGHRVLSIVPEKQQVFCANGISFSYDKLLLAVGGSVKFPPIPGLTAENGVLPFYTLQDTKTILHKAKQPAVKNVVIIGAGLSGLECADSIVDYVDSVTVIEREKHVLSRTIPNDAAQFIQAKMEQEGIKFLPNTCVNSVTNKSVTISNGTVLQADMIVCAMGAQPNGWLAKEAGLAVDNGAIVTDDFLKTSDQNIYAAGDVALVTDKLTGQKIKSCAWPDALVQGMNAASNMAQIPKKYLGTVTVTSSAFFGVKFVACGNLKSMNTSYNSKLRKNNESFALTFLENGVVKGFLLIGKTGQLSHLKRSLLTGQKIAEEMV